MDLVTIALVAGITLILLVVFLIGVIWFVRRRSATKSSSKKPKNKLKTSVKEPQPEEAEDFEPSEVARPESSPKPAVAPPVSAPTPGPAVSAIDDHTGEKIRILIVDDNPGTRDNVTRLLYFEDDLEVIGQAVNGREGIEMAVELKPHIVLMDINMPDMDGITATEQMGVKVPFSQVVIMSVQSDSHYMKQAMSAGARDFQPKPFTSEELVNCLRRVYNIGVPMYQQYEAIERMGAQQAAQPNRRGVEGEPNALVIAVYSPKGGVGTSAIAANLAVALHQEQGDVVLVDSVFQAGDIQVHLNTRPTRTVSDLVHEGDLEVDLLTDILLPHESGIKLLLAPSQPQFADFITVPMVTSIIDQLKKQFKIIVIDTETQLTDRTLTVLEAADYTLLVIVPELPAIKSAKLYLEIVEQLDFDPKHIMVAVNRANMPGGVRPDQIEKVLKIQGTYLIPYDLKMRAALNRGAAICQQDSHAPSAQAITNMARDMWQRITEADPEAIKEVA